MAQLAARLAEYATAYAELAAANVVLTGGWLLPRRAVELQRSVNDVDENRKRVVRYRLHCRDTECPPPVELPPSVSAMLPSPSGQRTVRVVSLDSKPQPRTCLELWERGSLLIRVDASKSHKKVLTEGTFGGFGWSHCEKRAVYVAEAKRPESPSPFSSLGAAAAAAAPEGDDNAPAGRANWFREDWGEQLAGSDALALFVVDFVEGSVKLLPGVPEDITPGQPVFWGEDVVYTGWSAGLRKLGLVACNQRPSSLYLASLIDSSQKHLPLAPELQISRAARPAPVPLGAEHKKGRLVFLGHKDGFETHTSCLELHLLDPATGLFSRCLVPAVAAPRHDGFAGICMDTALPQRCWAAGAIYFNSFIGARESAWRIGVAKDAEVERVEAPKGAPPDASVRVLDANDEGILLCWSDPCQPSRVAVRPLVGGKGLLGEEEQEVLLPALGPCAVVAGPACGPSIAEGLRWRVQGVTPKDGGARFDALLVEPVQMHKPGLILFLHGGPHMVATTAFTYAVPFLVRTTDCAVLLVNYRGSMGFGKQALETLPGNIGSQDVADCMAALQSALDTDVFDADRLAVIGGSHGGFLAAHLIGQHPGVFRAAAMRNPVTNVAAMHTATDIPDWTLVEGQGLGAYDFITPRLPTPEVLGAMWKKSPCAHVRSVTAATLIALGLKDRRVPPSQGMEYYHALRAHGVPTRLLCYDEEVHDLAGPASDADHWINVAAWFNEHLVPVAPAPPAPVDLLRGCSVTSIGV